MWAWEAGFRVAEGWVRCDLSDMISGTNEVEVCEMFNEGRGESRGGINTRLLAEATFRRRDARDHYCTRHVACTSMSSVI